MLGLAHGLDQGRLRQRHLVCQPWRLGSQSLCEAEELFCVVSRWRVACRGGPAPAPRFLEIVGLVYLLPPEVRRQRHSGELLGFVVGELVQKVALPLLRLLDWSWMDRPPVLLLL